VGGGSSETSAHKPLDESSSTEQGHLLRPHKRLHERKQNPNFAKHYFPGHPRFAWLKNQGFTDDLAWDIFEALCDLDCMDANCEDLDFSVIGLFEGHPDYPGP